MKALQLPGFGVIVNAVTVLVENDVINYALCAVRVLSVNAVSVTAIGRRSLITVVVNDAAVNFGIDRWHPETYADVAVVNHQIDQLAVRGKKLNRIRAGFRSANRV